MQLDIEQDSKKCMGLKIVAWSATMVQRLQQQEE